MSHPVTITAPTTITSNGFHFNCNYLRTFPGILKLGELILGIVTVGCVGSTYEFESANLFFLLMATTFMTCTFWLLLSCVITWRNSKRVSETMFELIYHAFATIFLLAASMTLATTYRDYYTQGVYTAAFVMGSLNSVLYFLSTHSAYKGLAEVQPGSGYYNSNTDFTSKLKTVDKEYNRYI